MSKINLEPRKTTWVKFIDEKAKMKVERKCKVQYYRSNILSNLTHGIDMKYLFTNLKSGKCIPSSQLIIKEGGIPVSITQTVVSLSPDKFSSATTYDPFVEIEDKVAKVVKSKVKEKKLSKRLIERTWSETVKRVIKIDNKTGKKILVELSVFENPADDILFTSSSPKPERSTPPERHWEINLKKEQEKVITLTFSVQRKENIRLPPDKTIKGRIAYQNQMVDAAEQQMDFPEELNEEAYNEEEEIQG